MTSHDACTSGTFRFLTISLLQRLKMEALIPAPADCEVRSMLWFFIAQNISLIEIHRQLCQVYGYTRSTVNTSRSSAGRCLIIIHSNLAPGDFHLFLFLKKFLPRQRQRFQNDREAEMSVTVVPIPGGKLLRHRIQTLDPRYDKCLNSEGEYVEK